MSISWGLQSGQFCFSYSQDLSTTSMGHSGLSSLLCCFQPNLRSAKFGTAPRASLDLYQAHPSLSWQHVSYYTVLKSLPLGFPWPLTELPHQAWIQAVALTLLGWNWDFLSPQNWIIIEMIFWRDIWIPLSVTFHQTKPKQTWCSVGISSASNRRLRSLQGWDPTTCLCDLL